jgi:hypothetical protein
MELYAKNLERSAPVLQFEDHDLVTDFYNGWMYQQMCKKLISTVRKALLEARYSIDLLERLDTVSIIASWGATWTTYT